MWRMRPLSGEPGDVTRAERLSIVQGGVNRAHAGSISISQGGIGLARGDRISVELGGVGAALASELHITQGAAGSIIARDVRLEQSAVRLIVANEVHAERTTGVLLLRRREQACREVLAGPAHDGDEARPERARHRYWRAGTVAMRVPRTRWRSSF